MQDKKKKTVKLADCPGHPLLHRLWDEDVCLYSELVASSYSSEGTDSLAVSPQLSICPCTISLPPISTSSFFFLFTPSHLRPLHLSSRYQCFTCPHLWWQDTACSAGFFDLIWLIVIACFSQGRDLGRLCQTRISFVQTVCLLLCCFTWKNGLSWAPQGRTSGTRCIATFSSLSVINVCAANPLVLLQQSYLSGRLKHTSQRPPPLYVQAFPPTRGPLAPAEQLRRSLTSKKERPPFRAHLHCTNLETLELQGSTFQPLLQG